MMSSCTALLLLCCASTVAHGQRVGPCDGAHKSSAWCDASKGRAARISALVKALTPAEKGELLSNTAQPIKRLGLPSYDWWNEAVHGFARVQFINGSDIHVNATSFPMSIGVSSSFNKSLWGEVGSVVGREARGSANANTYGVDALTFWAPNINIARDSRWGRNQETPGEDPTTNGAYATALTHGMQGEDKEWLQISACAKHFAVHSWNTPSTYMAFPTAQDLADTYLPAFETAVKAGVSGLMCSYNGVDGMPMCANSDLLPKVRSEWKFDGYIVSNFHPCSSVAVLSRHSESLAACCPSGLSPCKTLTLCCIYHRRPTAVPWATLTTSARGGTVRSTKSPRASRLAWTPIAATAATSGRTASPASSAMARSPSRSPMRPSAGCSQCSSAWGCSTRRKRSQRGRSSARRR